MGIKTSTKQFSGYRSQKRFDNEIKARTIFSEYAPKVFDYNTERLEITFEYIPRNNLVCNADHLFLIGQTLAKIHQKNLQNVLQLENTRMIDRYNNFQDITLLNLYHNLFKNLSEFKTGFIHGDFRLRNIISTQKGLNIIDWEFFGNNFIYWDLAIFVGDFVHQKYHKIQTISLKPFWGGYLSINYLSEEEIKLCKILGGLDIIADHLVVRAEEKLPEPHELFIDFKDSEKNYLLNLDNYL